MFTQIIGIAHIDGTSNKTFGRETAASSLTAVFCEHWDLKIWMLAWLSRRCIGGGGGEGYPPLILETGVYQ